MFKIGLKILPKNKFWKLNTWTTVSNVPVKSSPTPSTPYLVPLTLLESPASQKPFITQA